MIGRPGVHLECDILFGICAWHPLVLNVVQAFVSQHSIFPGQRHAADGRPTEVEGRLSGAAVSASRTLIGDDNPGRLGAAK